MFNGEATIARERAAIDSSVCNYVDALLSQKNRIFNPDGSIREFDESSFGGFFMNRLVDGTVRDDLNYSLSKLSVSSAALSVPLIAVGNVPFYSALQSISLISGAGAVLTGYDEASLAGFGSDITSAFLTAKLGVTTTPIGRATLSAFETMSAGMSFLYYEASKND